MWHSSIVYSKDQIIKQSDAPLQNLYGQITLEDLAGLLSQSRLAISDDTRTTHIAASEETPSVCILGGGYFGVFVPYPKLSGQINPINVVYHKMQCYVCNAECVYPLKEDEPTPCISNISADAVWSNVKPLLIH